MRHKHQWEEIERFYAEPSTRAFNANGMDASRIIERMVFGVTTIHYRCTGCPEHWFQEVLGAVQ